MNLYRSLFSSIAAALLFPAVLLAQEPAGVKRALLVCGHPGDAQHAALYSKVLLDIRTGLVTKLGFEEKHVHLQFGGKWPETDSAPQHGPATREALEAEAAELKSNLQPEDTLWVVLVGHSHYDGRKTTYNLPELDMTSLELGKLFAGLQCREQVFFITTSVSGFYLKPLAAKGRIVISATEADYETNETRFPLALAEELAKLSPDYPDVDMDGVRSLFDLYIGLAKNIAQRYTDDMALATEHSQLDDNGDGRGTEVQIDYLPVEQGGRSTGKPPPPRPATADGSASTKLILVPSAVPVPAVEAAPAP